MNPIRKLVRRPIITLLALSASWSAYAYAKMMSKHNKHNKNEMWE